MPSLLHDKLAVHASLHALLDTPVEQLDKAVVAAYAPDAHWRGSHPLNELASCDAIAATVWAPLREAMPDLERRDVLFMGGDYAGERFIGCVGHLLGRFERPWLGIAATGGAMSLRYGEYHQVRDGVITQSTVLFDVLDFIRQAGLWPLAPMLGSTEMWPCPLPADGVMLHATDAAEAAANLKLVLAMHKSLQDYDDLQGLGRQGLLAMPQKQYWHPQMMWYGPAGIGTSRGLAGFVDVHQLPFRQAFPNRSAIGHYARIGDGKYVGTGGWPSVSADHTGGNFMGLSPTGRKVTMRVMDFYLCDAGLIRENWIPLDVIQLLLQMDVDVFVRLHELGRGMVDKYGY